MKGTILQSRNLCTGILSIENQNDARKQRTVTGEYSVFGNLPVPLDICKGV